MLPFTFRWPELLTTKEAEKRPDVGPVGEGGAFHVQSARVGMSRGFGRPSKEFSRTGMGGRGERVGAEVEGIVMASV